jgi:hypothetical protein
VTAVPMTLIDRNSRHLTNGAAQIGITRGGKPAKSDNRVVIGRNEPEARTVGDSGAKSLCTMIAVHDSRGVGKGDASVGIDQGDTVQASQAPSIVYACVSNCVVHARPPNVPPLSSGRIRKRGGVRWGRASPWYFTTGEKEALLVTTRCGRLLQRLVGRRS